MGGGDKQAGREEEGCYSTRSVRLYIGGGIGRRSGIEESAATQSICLQSTKLPVAYCTDPYLDQVARPERLIICCGHPPTLILATSALDAKEIPPARISCQLTFLDRADQRERYDEGAAMTCESVVACGTISSQIPADPSIVRLGQVYPTVGNSPVSRFLKSP